MQMSLTGIILTSVLSFASMNAQAKVSAPKNENKVIHVCKKNDKPVDALACNIFFESRGENISGQMAVGFVTLNRLKDKTYPDSVKKIIYQKSQFSWVIPGTNRNVRDQVSWTVSKDIAKFLWKIKDNEILYNKLDPTNGSMYYHTKKVKPIWRHGLQKTVTIGEHVFYKDKGEKNA